MMVLLLGTLLAIACGALPDSAKSEETIAGELYECLIGADLEEDSMFEFHRRMGMSKDEIVTEMTYMNTKEELIEQRDKYCSSQE